MRLSNEQVKRLQLLLKEHCGLDYTDEQAQEAGAQIVRFVVAKARRSEQLTKQGVHRGRKEQRSG